MKSCCSPDCPRWDIQPDVNSARMTRKLPRENPNIQNPLELSCWLGAGPEVREQSKWGKKRSLSLQTGLWWSENTASSPVLGMKWDLRRPQVPLARLERTTIGLEVRCSIHLSYRGRLWSIPPHIRPDGRTLTRIDKSRPYYTKNYRSV
jgi:hypothetical protein